MFFFNEGFTFRNFFIDVLTIFFFVVWFWMLFVVASDLWRRSDISGWTKAAWIIGFILLPYIAVLGYIIFQGRGINERNALRIQQARDELRGVVGFSVSDELEKLARLKSAGTINDEEYARLRKQVMQ